MGAARQPPPSTHPMWAQSGVELDTDGRHSLAPVSVRRRGSWASLGAAGAYRDPWSVSSAPNALSGVSRIAARVSTPTSTITTERAVAEPGPSGSIRIPVGPVTTAAPTLDCTTGELVLTVHPDRASYNWGDTMIVTLHLALTSGPACRIPADACTPQVVVHFYDPTFANGTGLLGPFTVPCSSDPLLVASGSGAAVGVPARFGSSSGNTDCQDSHDGVEQWDGHLGWQLGPGHILSADPFYVRVVTPARASSTTTTTSTTPPATTTSTSTPPTTTSTT